MTADLLRFESRPIITEENTARVRELYRQLPQIQEAIAREREQLLEHLRRQLPGFEGRLDGPNLIVTPEEAEQLRPLAPFPRELPLITDPQPIALLTVIVEDPDGC